MRVYYGVISVILLSRKKKVLFTEAMRGTYFSDRSKREPISVEEYKKRMEIVYNQQLEKMPIDVIEKFLEKKKIKNGPESLHFF